MHTNAMQTNRAVCSFYALTVQFDERGSNVSDADATEPSGGRAGAARKGKG
jgi:hypothetical protein